MAALRKILFLPSTSILAGMLADPLADQGYPLCGAASIEEAAAIAGCGLALLDGPDLPADAVARLRRRQGLPLLLLAADAAQARAGLEQGATDCLQKPVRLAQLLARIATLFQPPPEDGRLRIGRFQFTPTARQIEAEDGAIVGLTEKETAILLFLHQAAPQPIPRETLLHQVWGYAAGATTHTVETHIYTLRRKLGEGVLLTDAGGYRLAGEL